MKDKHAEIKTAKLTFENMPEHFTGFAYCATFKYLYGKPIMEQTIMRRLRDINPVSARIYKYEKKLYRKIA